MEYLVGILLVLVAAVALGLFVSRRSRPKKTYTTGWTPYPRDPALPEPVPPVGGSGVSPAPDRHLHVHHYQTTGALRPAPVGYVAPPVMVQDDDDVITSGLIIGQAIAEIATDLAQPVYVQDDPQPFQGGGGSFGGGGDTASWTPDPTPEPERYEAPAYDPPSYDPPDTSSYDSPSSSDDN